MAIKQIQATQPYQDPAGNVLANGYITLDLSQPAVATGSGDVAPMRVSITLDATGKFAVTNLWANDQLTPSGTTYLVLVHNSNGLQVANLGQLSIQGTSPIDISQITPNVGGSGVSVPGVVLQNPSAAQTITGQSLTLTSSAPLIVQSATTFSGNNTHSGTETFTGLLIPKNFDNVQVVDSTLSRGGTDIGNEINLAYAALPYVSTGTGKIDVYPPTTNTCYNFSTPILLNTNNKPVIVDFHGACLTYTPATGTAMSLDTGVANTIVSSGFYNGHLTTSASTTSVGMVLGASGGNGCNHCMTNMEVDGFQNELLIGSANVHLWGAKFIGNSASGSICLSRTTPADDTKVFGGTFGQCNTLFNNTVSAGPVEFIGTNLNEAKGGALGTNVYVNHTINERLTFTACHFSAIATRPVFWTQTAGRLIFVNTIFEDDLVSGTPTSYATTSGGLVGMIGGDISSSGESVTEFVLLSGSAQAFFSGVSNTFSPALIPLLWNTSYGGGQVTELGTMTNAFTNTHYFNYSTLSLNTSTCAAGSVNTGKLCHDTGTNRLSMNNNNSGLDQIVGRASTDTLTNKTLNVPLSNGTGLQIFNTTTTCTTGASVGATCTTAAISLPVAEADTSYRVSCTGKGPTAVPVISSIANSSATQFTITIAALTAVAASFSSYDCVAGHN